MSHFGRGGGGWGGGGRSSNAPVVEESPAWVRQCVEEFKQDKCFFTHELRTLDSWRRFNKRLETSPYRTICRSDFHDDPRTLVPHMDISLLPAELRRGIWGAKRRKTGPTTSRDELKREEGEEEEGGGTGGAPTEGATAADGEARRGSDDEWGEGEEEEEGDLEMADYAVGKHYDDDEDLVDEDGGGSEDEEARYGTY